MTTKQFILFTALGIIFWFTAAMIVRLCGANVFANNNPWLIGFFVLAIPVTFVFLFVTKTLSKLQYSQLLKPVVILTFTATLLDGIAMSCFHNLYSQSFEVAFYGAAWILWGVGLGLVAAYFLEKKKLISK